MQCKHILPPWQIAPILRDIRNMVSSCEFISFSHIYREGNTGADWMAKLDCSFRTSSVSIFSSRPCTEFFCILVDNLGKTLVKRAT